MKKLFFFSSIVALLVSCNNNNSQMAGAMIALTTGTKTETRKNMENEKMTYFRFDHHNTMVMDIGEKYEVSKTKDGRIHIVIDESLPREKELYTSDSSIFDDLLAIVKKYKTDKYKSEYRPLMDVYDGDSWSLYYRYDSKRSVVSEGYMSYPKNYREMRNALTSYFNKWRECQEGVLSIDYFKFTAENKKGVDIEYALERGEKEATLTLRDAERGINKSMKISNDDIDELHRETNRTHLKASMYDNHTNNPEATRYTYFVRYNTGDTLSGYTCHMQSPSHKVAAIMRFFNRWID